MKYGWLRDWVLLSVLALCFCLFTPQLKAGESSGGDGVTVGEFGNTPLPDFPKLKYSLADLDISPGEGVPKSTVGVPKTTPSVSESGESDSKIVDSGSESEVGGVMSVILGLLGRPEIQTIVFAAFALIFGIVKRLSAVKQWRLTRAVECLEAGVRVTYEEYVRAMKDAALDGKLTDDERREARSRAIQRAKEYAANSGIDLMKVYAKEFLPVIVEKILSRNKVTSKLPFVSASGLGLLSQ